jgi:hypothetical protein
LDVFRNLCHWRLLKTRIRYGLEAIHKYILCSLDGSLLVSARNVRFKRLTRGVNRGIRPFTWPLNRPPNSSHPGEACQIEFSGDFSALWVAGQEARAHRGKRRKEKTEQAGALMPHPLRISDPALFSNAPEKKINPNFRMKRNIVSDLSEPYEPQVTFC